MKKQTCTTCEIEYPCNGEYYHKKAKSPTGYATRCKSCCKEYQKKYYSKNKDKAIDRATKWNSNNKERRNRRWKERYDTDEVFREKHIKSYKKSMKKDSNKETRNKRVSLYRKDPDYKLRELVSSSVYYGLKKQGGHKDTSCWEYLPYSKKQLREHLENQFDEHMTWENHGSYWHVDHIYPQSLLPYDTLDHPNFLKCWSLDNLQPLKGSENIRKSNKVHTDEPK